MAVISFRFLKSIAKLKLCIYLIQKIVSISWVSDLDLRSMLHLLIVNPLNKIEMENLKVKNSNYNVDIKQVLSGTRTLFIRIMYNTLIKAKKNETHLKSSIIEFNELYVMRMTQIGLPPFNFFL